MTRVIVFAFIFFICILPSYAQTTVIREEIYGFSDMENSIKKIATSCRKSNTKFEDCEFPTWKLSYKDYRIIEGQLLKLTLLPKEAFTVSPQSVEIEERGQPIVFKVTLNDPNLVLNKDGEVKVLNAWIKDYEDSEFKFDFNSSAGKTDIIDRFTFTDKDDFQPEQIKDDFQAFEHPSDKKIPSKLGTRDFTFKSALRVSKGKPLIVFLPTTIHQTKTGYNLNPGCVAIYMNANYLKQGLYIKGYTKISATNWDDREEASSWTYYFENDPWIEKIEFVRGSFNNSMKDFRKKVSSLFDIRFSD